MLSLFKPSHKMYRKTKSPTYTATPLSTPITHDTYRGPYCGSALSELITCKPCLLLTCKHCLPLTCKPCLPLTCKPCLLLTCKPCLPLTCRRCLLLTCKHSLVHGICLLQGVCPLWAGDPEGSGRAQGNAPPPLSITSNQKTSAFWSSLYGACRVSMPHAHQTQRIQSLCLWGRRNGSLWVDGIITLYFIIH